MRHKRHVRRRCPVCDWTYPVRDDGRMFLHRPLAARSARSGVATCPGSGQLPLPRDDSHWKGSK